VSPVNRRFKGERGENFFHAVPPKKYQGRVSARGAKTEKCFCSHLHYHAKGAEARASPVVANKLTVENVIEGKRVPVARIPQQNSILVLREGGKSGGVGKRVKFSSSSIAQKSCPQSFWRKQP